MVTIYTFEATGSDLDISMFEEKLFPVSPDMEILEEERQTYQKIVGSILFAVISSRSDIIFTTLQLSKFN